MISARTQSAQRSAPELIPHRRVPALRRALLRWYEEHARDLPWRRTRDPYRVWLSEILLQQTQVAAVIPYYERFLRVFPTVDDLADASLDQVLRVWAGLGYYARGRNLHAAARIIAHQRGGTFPDTAVEWQQLPGIGQYTSGAIASIVHDEPIAAVDGNVLRVLARLESQYAPVNSRAGKELISQRAAILLDSRRPGDFNQALMDLGARICLPKTPQCPICPLRNCCSARRSNTTTRLPVRLARSTPQPVTALAGLISRGGRWLLMRRPPHGLLGGLWGWPAVEFNADADQTDALHTGLVTLLGIKVVVGPHLAMVKHTFTHRRLTLHVYYCRANSNTREIPPGYAVRWVRQAELGEYALSAIDRKVITAWQTSCGTKVV